MKKMIATLLVLSVTWVAGVQRPAEAMLVPAAAGQPALQTSRSQDLKTIQKTLESKLLRAKLHAMGLSDAEIQTRLTRLSDQQVHQFASQIRAVNPAGDILIPILVAVLLVVLIIYLIKRI